MLQAGKRLGIVTSIAAASAAASADADGRGEQV